MQEALWNQHDMENKITAILENIAWKNPEHHGQHYGQPFFTAYQLAIEFAVRFPQAFEAIRKPVGGSGTGQYSLTQYLARELTRRIGDRTIQHIEMAWINTKHVHSLEFKYNNEVIPYSGYISIYRLADSGAD